MISRVIGFFTAPEQVRSEPRVDLSPFSLVIIGLILAATVVSADLAFLLGPIKFYPPELAIYGLTALALFRRDSRAQLVESWQATDRLVRQAIGLILVGALIATVVSPIFPNSIGGLKAWIVAPLFLFLLAVSFLKNFQPIIRMAAWTAVFLIILSLVELSQIGLGPRLTAYYESPNYLAALAAPIAVLLIWQGLKEQRLLLILGLALVVILILTQSIGAFLGIGLASVTAWLYLGKVGKTLVVTALVALVIIFGPILKDRLSQEQNSLSSRQEMWRAAIQMITVWPLTGAGIRGYEVHYPQFIAQVSPNPQEWSAAQPHNFILSLWVALGLLGVLGFALLIIRVIPWSGMPTPFHLALLTILGHGLVDTPYFRHDLAVVFWLYIAALEIYRRSIIEQGNNKYVN